MSKDSADQASTPSPFELITAIMNNEGDEEAQHFKAVYEAAISTANTTGDKFYDIVHYCSINDRQDFLDFLLRRNSNLLTTRDPISEYNILHQAVSHGDLKATQLILEKDPELLRSISGKCTNILHIAASRGHTDIIEFILAKAPDLLHSDTIDIYRNNSIHLAAVEDQTAVVKLLVEKDPALLYSCNRFGHNPLWLAIKAGHTNIVEFIAAKAPDLLHSANNAGDGALHIAIAEEQTAVVKLLVEKDPALLDALDRFGNTSLRYAVFGEHEGIVRLLLQKGAILKETTSFIFKAESLLEPFLTKIKNLQRDLRAAIKDGDTKKVEKILDDKDLSQEDKLCVLNSKGANGRNSLWYAIDKGNEKTLAILLRHGADASLTNKDKDGKTDVTPLEQARAGKNSKILEVLEREPTQAAAAHQPLPEASVPQAAETQETAPRAAAADTDDFWRQDFEEDIWEDNDDKPLIAKQDAQTPVKREPSPELKPLLGDHATALAGTDLVKTNSTPSI